MSGHRPGRHSPWRSRHERPDPHLAAVRYAGRGRYELALSPGAGVADLVAAAGILPPGVVYTAHRPATPAHPTAVILVFQTPPADPANPGDLGGVPARPSPARGPRPLPSGLFATVDPNPEHGVPVAAAAAKAVEATMTVPTTLATPSAFPTSRRPLAHRLTRTHRLTFTHRDSHGPLTAPGDAADTTRHEQQAA